MLGATCGQALGKCSHPGQGIFRNQGRLKGQGESKSPGRAPRVVSRSETGWAGLPATLALKGTARRAETSAMTSDGPRVPAAPPGEPHTLCSLLSNNPPSQPLKAESPAHAKAGGRAHLVKFNCTPPSVTDVFTVVSKVCFPQEASSPLWSRGFQCKLQIHGMALKGLLSGPCLHASPTASLSQQARSTDGPEPLCFLLAPCWLDPLLPSRMLFAPFHSPLFHAAPTSVPLSSRRTSKSDSGASSSLLISLRRPPLCCPVNGSGNTSKLAK